MSSVVKQITDGIEARLAAIIPTFSKSPYAYSVGTNNFRTNNKKFRVLPSSGNSVEGSLRTITIAQQFQVMLSTGFTNKNSSDDGLQASIEDLYSALEIVTLEAYQRRFTTARIMSVSNVEMTAPEVDYGNETVSVGATYLITYRME